MRQRLPFVVLGPGAIGGAVAGALIEVGHDPVLAVRTTFDRLRVTTPDRSIDAAVETVDTPSLVGRADMVFVAVKAHQTEAIRPWLDALVDGSSTVVILQNGVEHCERFAPLVHPEAALVPAVVALPALRSAPGRITVSSSSRLTVPTGDGSEALRAALEGSFLTVTVTDDWLTAAWTKLMLNAASGGMCAVVESGNALFVDDEEAVQLAIELMEEVATVGRAEGAALDADLAVRVMNGLRARAGRHFSSIVVDRRNGVATEWDARNAVVARIAARHGIDVPLNRLLATLLRLGEPAVEAVDS